MWLEKSLKGNLEIHYDIRDMYKRYVIIEIVH